MNRMLSLAEIISHSIGFIEVEAGVKLYHLPALLTYLVNI